MLQGVIQIYIDTIRICNPYPSEEFKNAVKNKLVCRQAIENETGEILYNVTNKSLEGSFDNRIYVGIKYDKSTYQERIDVECNINKLIIGHNVGGVISCPYEAGLILVGFINKLAGIESQINEWQYRRIDYAKMFNLGYEEAVKDYFIRLNSAEYSRRNVKRDGVTGLYSTGSTTSLILYHKGTEFKKNKDYTRCKHVFGDIYAKRLLEYAKKCCG